MINVGEQVLSRDYKLVGKITGSSKVCTLEGCRGRKIGVRWPKIKGKAKVTYPCTAGMIQANGVWHIE